MIMAYYGYYSAIADRKFGHHVYRTPNGKTVKVTEAIQADKSPMSKWEDLKCVGEIVACLTSNPNTAHSLGMTGYRGLSAEERIAAKLYNALPISPDAVAKRNPHGLN